MGAAAGCDSPCFDHCGGPLVWRAASSGNGEQTLCSFHSLHGRCQSWESVAEHERRNTLRRELLDDLA